MRIRVGYLLLGLILLVVGLVIYFFPGAFGSEQLVDDKILIGELYLDMRPNHVMGSGAALLGGIAMAYSAMIDTFE